MPSALRLLLVSVFLASLVPGKAQTDLDAMLERSVPNCNDVGLNALRIISRTYASGDLDSTALVVAAWKEKCPDEPAFRVDLLLHLETDSAVRPLLNEEGFAWLWVYAQMAAWPLEVLQREAPVFLELMSFTRPWANELLLKYAPGTLEYDLCTTYGPNPGHLFQRLQDPDFPDMDLRIRYAEEVAKYTDLGEFHASLFTGIWMPTGDLKPLGSHPTFGFQLGGKRRHLSYDLTIAFDFGSSGQVYSAKRNSDADSTERTSYFFGTEGSVDFGWDVLDRGANEIQVNAGVGFMGFDAFESEKDVEDMAGSTAALDLSAGLTYRRYLTSWSYLGLQVKYHYVDFAKSGIVDMHSSPITVRVIYGGLMNLRKQGGLEALGYKYRQ
jgi:hypothetical protein